MDGKKGITQIIIDEVHSSDIQADKMEGVKGVTRRIIDELHFSEI